MATCPPVPVYDDDPFVYYAKRLISSFKSAYGVSTVRKGGINPFQDGVSFADPSYDGARSWHNTMDDWGHYLRVVDPSIGAYISGRPDVEENVIIRDNIVDWDTALPFYIKGPRWEAFDDYQTEHWKASDQSFAKPVEGDTGWFDMAGTLVVHPMLRTRFGFYAAESAIGTSRDCLWEDWFEPTRETRDVFPFPEYPGAFGVPIVAQDDNDMRPILQFSFLLEVLDAFLYINDDKGGNFLKPDMEPFTWCQMFWTGYEHRDIVTRTHLGQGTTGANHGPAWNGQLDPPDSGAKIVYFPKNGVHGQTAVASVGSLSAYGPDSSKNRAPGGIHSWAQAGYEPLGHSVRIVNADYRAFVFWLQKALEILDEADIGPVSIGPGFNPGDIDGVPGDLLSSVYDWAGLKDVSVDSCSITGPPYGGLIETAPYDNRCSIGVFRAMADNLYFNDGSGLPLSDELSDAEVDYWSKFLHEHSVSVSLSTEALNRTIESEGVSEAGCSAVELDVTNSLFAGVDPGSCRIEPEDALGVQTYQTCIPNPDAIVPNWLNQTEEEPFLNQKTCEYSIVMLADPPECSDEYLSSFIPAAIDKLLEYYNKETNVDFINLSSLGKVPTNSKDALMNGSNGLYLDGLTFSGTATVRNFYIPPRPLAKTKELITVSAEEFNRIPSKQPKIEEGTPTPIYREGEPSFVVFSAAEMESVFDKVSYSLELYDRLYAQWHLETGKTIKGLNFNSEAKRVENFF